MNHLLVTAAESVGLYNPLNGSLISSLNVPPALPHATSLVPSRPHQGGLIFSSALSKPLLHIYSFQKNQPLHNMVLPEKATCLDVDSSATWCATGTPSGRIYLWEIPSGSLFASFTAHYRAVTVLRFHSDGQTFVTGSEDSMVSIWSVPRIVDYESSTQVPLPLQTFTDHTLPITSLHIGIGTLSTSRIFSCSLDATVKIWTIDPHTKSDSPDPSFTLLATFDFPHPIGEIAVDPLERYFFAASTGDGGEIFQAQLFTEKKPVRNLANGAHGSIQVSPDKPIVAKSKVTSLAISLTSDLLVGTQIGQVQVYSLPSRTLLRTITTSQSPNPSPVTLICSIPKPIDLLGHVELNIQVRTGEESIPIRPVLPFGRTRDVRGKGREISIILPTRPGTSHVAYDPMEDYAYFTTTSSSSRKQQEDANAKAERLESEVQRLKEQLGKARSINDAMWESLVQSKAGKAKPE